MNKELESLFANHYSSGPATYTTHVFYARLDGVLFAAADESEALTKLRMDEIIAEATFHHLKESETLRQAHKVALYMLKHLPPEDAKQLRNLRSQKLYGTCKIEDPAAPEINITFED